MASPDIVGLWEFAQGHAKPLEHSLTTDRTTTTIQRLVVDHFHSKLHLLPSSADVYDHSDDCTLSLLTQSVKINKVYEYSWSAHPRSMPNAVDMRQAHGMGSLSLLLRTPRLGIGRVTNTNTFMIRKPSKTDGMPQDCRLLTNGQQAFPRICAALYEFPQANSINGGHFEATGSQRHSMARQGKGSRD
ncbi:unnamed protein product [Soboliphyme baturini]|uniref:Lipocalin-like domain-containing protein n=1 Tax=Soboliphyme baturini TaxID=241478 RepID=A0A183INP2_9BILA|nr:unnamed protein product [Soboliphyme baturini]